MASREPGGSAFTPTSGGQGLTLSLVLTLTCFCYEVVIYKGLKCGSSILMDYPVEASHPPISRFRLNESHLIAAFSSLPFTF